MLLLSVAVSATDAWQLLGHLQVPGSPAAGQLSLNMQTLRRRENHYEIWQRLQFDAPESGERRTLWAVRCGRGRLARVAESQDGMLEPRAEKLHFYTPAPGSAGAAVVESTCREVQRRLAEQAPEDASGGGVEGKRGSSGLGGPPPILEGEIFDESDD